MRRSRWIWGGRIAAVTLVAGLAAYLASVGLDKADKLASVLGLLVALAALAAPYLLPPSDGDRPRPVQRVTNTVVGGHLTQARDARGVRVRSAAASALQQVPQPLPDPAPEGSGGQYVNGVWIGGDLTQVYGADDNITIG